MAVEKRRTGREGDIAIFWRGQSRRQQARAESQADLATGSAAPQSETPESSPFNAAYLRRLKAHDPEIEKHFDSYFRRRLRVMLSFHSVPECDKPDIIQETLLQSVMAVQEDRVRTPESFGSFVTSVCLNVMRKNLHRLKRRAKDVCIDDIDIADSSDSAEARMLRRETRKVVKKVLDDLRPKDRRLLKLKVIDGLSAEEMMAKCGARAPATLRTRVHRALKIFREAYKAAGLDRPQERLKKE